jgi:uncharacterized membrane protein YhaH (DUF805 family)
MEKEKNTLSNIRNVFCINCYTRLTLNLAERRGDEQIVCSKCKESFTLEQAKSFLSKISPIKKGKCPNCYEELDFYIKDRVTRELILCPSCNDKFYMSEVIPTYKERPEYIQEFIPEDKEQKVNKENVLKEEKATKERAFDLYKKAFQEYVNFKGRSTRREYWSFFLINMGIGFTIQILAALVSPSFEVISVIYTLFAFLPSLSILVRRLHDTNRSGWHFLVTFIPIVGFFVILSYLLENSYPEENEYGETKI